MDAVMALSAEPAEEGLARLNFIRRDRLLRRD